MKHGNLGELAVQLEMAKRGYEIYTPAVDNGTYDMLAVKDGVILKVEVKTSSYFRNGRWEVCLKSVRSNKTANRIVRFDNTKVDILAVYIEPEDTVLIFDAKRIQATCSLKINLGEVVESGLLLLP